MRGPATGAALTVFLTVASASLLSCGIPEGQLVAFGSEGSGCASSDTLYIDRKTGEELVCEGWEYAGPLTSESYNKIKRTAFNLAQDGDLSSADRQAVELLASQLREQERQYEKGPTYRWESDDDQVITLRVADDRVALRAENIDLDCAGFGVPVEHELIEVAGFQVENGVVSGRQELGPFLVELSGAFQADAFRLDALRILTEECRLPGVPLELLPKR